MSRCKSVFFVSLKLFFKGFWRNRNFVFLKDKIFMEGRSGVSWAQDSEENIILGRGNNQNCLLLLAPWPWACGLTPPAARPQQGVSPSPCTRPRICFWSVLSITHTFYFSGDFWNAPFSSSERNITCIIWHFFLGKWNCFQKLIPFSRSDLFWSVEAGKKSIHIFSWTVLLKRLSCRWCGLLFCLQRHKKGASDILVWPNAGMAVALYCYPVSRWRLQQRRSRVPAVLITIGDDLASWLFKG